MLTKALKEQVTLVQTGQRMRSRNLNKGGLDERLNALSKLKALLVEKEDLWLAALHKDLKKPAVEAYSSELAVLLNEIDFVKKHLKTWMTPSQSKRRLLNGKEKTVTHFYPYGSVLVIAPWNYPLQLALMPVIGAIAAGNGVVLKPSEFASATSGLLAELVPQYFDPSVLFVVEGNQTVSEGLTNLRWDFLFFTGSPAIGKKVYEAAAKHLTPVILELGGKNPCMVDESGLTRENLEKIAWGKFLNAGQSCIAPDTVYVEESVYEEFLEQMKDVLTDFYGEDPQKSTDYGRLIHEKHYEKVAAYLKDGTVYYGGECSKPDHYISPTLLTNIKNQSPVMEEELFGPILPVIPYKSFETLTAQLQEKPVPLVTYLFSEDKQMVHWVEEQLESGAVSVNQVIVHAASPHLPFGGKGKSGLGRYHGETSFKAFSYFKTTFHKKTPFSLSQQYPPYSKIALKALRQFRKRLF